jgi:hypothetical protein
MFFNSISFYNYIYLENCSLYQSKLHTVNPQFRVNFNFPSKQKKRIIQTSDLLYQFFSTRPKINVVKRFEKVVSFNIFINLSNQSLMRFFRILYFIRRSSRKKLINFNFKRNGKHYISLQDFVTLFPFKIRAYDFHDWRFTFSLSSVNSNFKPSDFCAYNIINFYINFF